MTGEHAPEQQSCVLSASQPEVWYLCVSYSAQNPTALCICVSGWVLASSLLFPSSCVSLFCERALCAADSASVLQRI